MQTVQAHTAGCQKICLLGFQEKKQQQEIANSLTEIGHQIVRIPDAADLLLLGPGAIPSRYESHKRPGLKIKFADEFVKMGKINGLRHEPTEIMAAEEAIVSGEKFVEVCGIRVEKCDTAKPAHSLMSADNFKGLVFDKPFLISLRNFFLGLLERKNVALSGPTATAKTTVVLFAAHLLGHPVRRLNLCSSSDAGDLVGRFVPATANDTLDFDALAPDDESLSSGTRTILLRSREKGIPLSANDKYRILSKEGIAPATWKFQEGAVPRCLRDGAWLLLDELNLLDASVAERISPALEIPATLALTEHNGEVFGHGGTPVHPDYRAFASMNHASYAGRSILSEALRRRFGIWIHSPNGGFAEARHYLNFLAYGDHPPVKIDGRTWRGPKAEPLLPELSALPSPASAFDALARFHTNVSEAAVGQAIGRHRREPYVYTREHLKGTAARVARRIAEGCPASLDLLSEAISLFYLSGLDNKADIAAVHGFLRAAGLR